MIIKNPMCTRVTASVDYHLASSQTKFALLVRQSIQLIIMKQYLNLKLLQASSVCSIFTWTFQEFQDRRLFNFYGIPMRNTSKVHLTYSLLRRMRGSKITLKNQGLVAQIKRNLVTKLRQIDIIFKQIDEADDQDKN